MEPKTQKNVFTVLLYAALIFLALLCILPFWLMIVNSTRSGVEITHGFSFLPSTHLQENWVQLFAYVNLFRGLFNSVKVAIPATLLTAYFSAILQSTVFTSINFVSSLFSILLLIQA